VSPVTSLPLVASALRSPALGGWCQSARPDPLTELVAFPDFDSQFPDLLDTSLRHGRSVGLAIGDVDHLKEYVETANELDPRSFGHLAGNALMRDLGHLTIGWLHRQHHLRAVAATFGGDEVIIAAEVGAAETFHAQVTGLAALLSAELPRTVSFAMTVLTPAQLPSATPGADLRRHLYFHLLATVDRCLFATKRARAAGDHRPFVTTAVLAALPPVGSAA